MSLLPNDCTLCGREAYDLAGDLVATFGDDPCPLCGRAAIDHEPEEPTRRVVRASADFPPEEGR